MIGDFWAPFSFLFSHLEKLASGLPVVFCRGPLWTLSYVDPALLTGRAVECHKLVFSLSYRKRIGLEFMSTILIKKKDVPGKSIGQSVSSAQRCVLYFALPCLANA